MRDPAFRAEWIAACDDDGIYYIRQIERSDGIGDFEGIVWFGQQNQDEPEFANVFIGVCRPNVARQEAFAGEFFDVSAWDGRFVDVPKGRVCGGGRLDLESTMVIAPPLGGCGLPRYHLLQVSSDGFGGQYWPILSEQNCYEWQVANGYARGRGLPLPPMPPLYRRAHASGASPTDSDIASALSSRPVPPGFQSSGDNLTGQWRDGNGGTYYVRQLPGTNDVVWFAESDYAFRPFRSDWAHVFWGSVTSDRVSGLWADVPRGDTSGGGALRLDRVSRTYMRRESATGGFRSEDLHRVTQIGVSVDVESLTILDTQESEDDLTLFVSFFKIDGDTVNLDDLERSTGTVQTSEPINFAANQPVGSVLPVTGAGSTYTDSLTSILSETGESTREETMIGVTVFVYERDRRSTAEDRAELFAYWSRQQLGALNRPLSSGRLPNGTEIATAANSRRTRYRWGDQDDMVGGNTSYIRLFDLLNNPEHSRTITLRGREGGEYEVAIRYTATDRTNPGCA